MTRFKLKENQTTVKTELIAGLTTFFAMLYIIPVNASIMSAAGMPFGALVTATALMTIFASIVNGLWANTPVSMSVGMGLNAYFTFGLVHAMKIPWETALGIVFISGILYMLISITPLRQWMIDTIPIDIKRAVSAGIGAFIAFIGLKEMGVIVHADATLVSLGNLKDPAVILGLFGLAIGLYFTVKKYRGALILSILITAVVAWFFGLEKFPDTLFSMPASIMPIALHVDLVSAFSIAFIPVIITFLVTDIFDTLGTLTGVGLRAGMFQEKRSVELQKTIQADAVATAVSALAGVTSTTSFIESAAGVEEGGRTGLSAITTGILFLLPLFMLPFFEAIHSNAIYPVLVIVGALMFSELRSIDYGDPAVMFSAFFIVLMMPLTYSITNGLMLGAFVYVLIELIQGNFAKAGGAMGLLSAIGILIFFIV
ncbi:MAG: NCS2 family permease [Campylobacterota bacterium]|nr:NCS2 family permease [Campylobacterota bacterium]